MPREDAGITETQRITQLRAQAYSTLEEDIPDLIEEAFWAGYERGQW